MNTVYIDCRMGVTATKLFGALMDLLENPNEFVYTFNRIGLEGLELHRMPEAKKGILGTELEWRRVAATADDPYADEMDDNDKKPKVQIKRTRRNLSDVKRFIECLRIEDNVKERAIKVYERIAEAAAKANDKNPQTMTLHRTGSKDVIASVVGVCMVLDKLKPIRVISSTVAVGEGFAFTPKGKMTVPVPEVQALLGDTPCIPGKEDGEMCSLDGAALITEITDEFGAMPEMSVIRSGAGFGYRHFKSGVNCVRASIGNSIKTVAATSMIELSTELYGVSSEIIGMLCDRLRDEGVISAYMQSIVGISGDDGLLFRCIVDSENADKLANIVIEYSSTGLVQRSQVGLYKNCE